MKRILILFLIASLFVIETNAQRRNRSNSSSPTINAELYKGMTWRQLGPFRGGRSATVTGVQGKPNLYYMGATGGGVWRTSDAGNTWENISDGSFGGSIGAVAVSEWDNNVIYVGGGEVTVRGNVSSGYGMWKQRMLELPGKILGSKTQSISLE